MGMCCWKWFSFFKSQKIKQLCTIQVLPTMKFYKDSDYAELVKDLLELIPIRVYAFLDSHSGNTNEHLSDWIIGLRKYIMIDLGLVKNQKDTPELINIAYSWMEKKLTDLVKETDKKANFQFYKPVKDWTEEEFERNKKQILEANSNPFRDKVINSLIQLFESKQAEYLEYQNNKIKNEWHFDPNKPLKNYEEVFRRYESYLNHIDWDIEGFKHFKAFTKDFEGFEPSVEMYILNVIHRAKQEINQQVFTQNNNSERIINNTKNKINSIIKSLEKNSKENNLSNADMILKYRFYLDAVQPFWDFSDWFRKEILGESLTETESPTIENTKNNSPEPPQKLIVFTEPETIIQLAEILSIYFPEREPDLNKALAGEKIKKPLLFPSNQNKLVELFRRVSYNSKILSSNAEINKWICMNFEYTNKKNENIPFNTESVRDILDKGKTMPPPKNRIAVDQFPFKKHDTLIQEKKSNK